jgi:hypothetical protein
VLVTLALLFELQKERVNKSSQAKSRMVWFYSAIVFFVWAGASYLSYSSDLSGEKALVPREVRAFWSCALTLLGIIAAVAAYVLPKTAWFESVVTRAKSSYQRNESGAATGV